MRRRVPLTCGCRRDVVRLSPFPSTLDSPSIPVTSLMTCVSSPSPQVPRPRQEGGLLNGESSSPLLRKTSGAFPLVPGVLPHTRAALLEVAGPFGGLGSCSNILSFRCMLRRDIQRRIMQSSSSPPCFTACFLALSGAGGSGSAAALSSSYARQRLLLACSRSVSFPCTLSSTSGSGGAAGMPQPAPPMRRHT